MRASLKTAPRSLRAIPTAATSDRLWYKDAIVYQVHVRAFADSNGDGIGDLRGLAEKLDYLRDLGVSALWLLPFYPSPLRDDGYDIADYGAVHPDYGTLADFRHLLREAHRRGLGVITELVLNHTSDQHPWFQRARRLPAGHPQRDFYVWSDSREKYKDTRIIFKDFEASNWSWDPVANAYYWHRFYHHQPDLNYDNPEVKKAVFQVVDFWLGMGVDGLRLDAVPYLIEREGTNCENLPETHQVLKELRRRVDAAFPNRMLLAEANQWPEDAVAYFGEGDECHMAFHFPVMPRMFMAVRMENRYPIIDILSQTPPIPDVCQWSVFLRNHDELTLEMVTDEERDYMYRVYAHDPRARINLGIRRRLAALLGNDRRRIELMNGLLFSLPGTPILYYGDEIGMGDNIYLGDRNSVRTPMQWSADRNAGFSRANSQRLYLPVIIDPDFHYEALNVEAQQNNANSLLWWMKRLIALRKRHQAFGRGSIEFLYPENRKVLAFVRRHQDELILVVANLSRHAQFVELDLSEFKGTVPRELFGQTEFPAIGELPYLLTLGPFAFYWFALEPSEAEGVEERGELAAAAIPHVKVKGPWSAIFKGADAARLETVLPRHLGSRRWFGGKARRIASTELLDAIAVGEGGEGSHIALVRVEYTEGDPETYLMPLAFARGARARKLLAPPAQEVVVRLECEGGEGVIFNALVEEKLCQTLLDAIARRRRFRGQRGEIAGRTTRAFRRLRGPGSELLQAALMRAEQSNSSIQYGERFILKLFRRVDEGINPDLEIGAFLTERAAFPHVPPLAGAIEYRPRRGEPMSLGVLQGFIPNEGDAWKYTLDVLGRYFERVVSRAEAEEAPLPEASPLDLAQKEAPAPIRELIGLYIESARLLGRRTAELHNALASEDEEDGFVPEPFTPHYQRSLYQSMRNTTVQSLELLRKRVRSLHAEEQRLAHALLDRKEEMLTPCRALLERKIAALRTRTHGDYHLGQVLYTGKDFVIIDFEGEPALPLSARRIKRSPLRDVAGMMRSFHYAGYTAMLAQVKAGMVRQDKVPVLEPWSRVWISWVGAAFLRAYLEAAAGEGFLPRARDDLRALLDAHLIEKAAYELGYELNNRPDWVGLPLRAILQMLPQGA